jgi:50S ribosomal protein L16 3-hydroxylase
MFFNQSELTVEQFLAEYWQKKPLLIRQAFADFEPELNADDIAGLACDELAESRLVTGSFPAHDWVLRYGPFDEQDFKNLPATDWTLLVQDVEKHYSPLQNLVNEFSFIPRWRIDDLMASVAGPGGSVGPHTDQYDVFLLQAEGRRRWQISHSYDHELVQDCELKVLRRFVAEQEWVLEPGDMLYLPPGVAHHGLALDQCMTWSIGMRAPSTADLLQSLGEWLAGVKAEGKRYGDPELKAAALTGEVDASAISRFRDLVHEYSNDEQLFTEFLGAFLSRYRLAHEPAPPGREYDSANLQAALRQGHVLRHNPWTRLLWLETAAGARLFAAGAHYSCSPKIAATICDPLQLERLGAGLTSAESALLCALLNDGHLYLES